MYIEINSYILLDTQEGHQKRHWCTCSGPPAYMVYPLDSRTTWSKSDQIVAGGWCSDAMTVCPAAASCLRALITESAAKLSKEEVGCRELRSSVQAKLQFNSACSHHDWKCCKAVQGQSGLHKYQLVSLCKITSWFTMLPSLLKVLFKDKEGCRKLRMSVQAK